MNCKNSNFWIGLGIGSVLGALAYAFSRTEKARQLKENVCQTLHEIGGEAGEMMHTAKGKAIDAGTKVVETGAKVAGKMSDKAEDLKDKWNDYATEAKK